MKIKTIFKILGPFSYIIIALVVGAVFCILFFSLHKERITIEVRPGEIKDIKSMVQLCSMDIYNEVPIIDTINGRVLFAIQKQNGSISFDMEDMKIINDSDTVIITLTPEIIELYESTEPESWKIIDSKAIGTFSMFRSDEIPLEDENILKGRIKERSIKQLYNMGVVETARLDGANTLKDLLEKVYKKPVLVMDPTPKGAYYKSYYDPNI